MSNSAPLIRLHGHMPEAHDFELDSEAEDLQLQSERTDPDFEPVEIRKAQVGEKVVFLTSGTVYQRAEGSRLQSQVSRAGEVYELTRGDIENVDRDGNNFWDLVHQPERQVARWGVVRFEISNPETDPALNWTDPRWVPENDADRDEARVAARAIAVTLPEPDRTEALREITNRFGRESTSKTFMTYKD